MTPLRPSSPKTAQKVDETNLLIGTWIEDTPGAGVDEIIGGEAYTALLRLSEKQLNDKNYAIL
jgi:hypothetical protein